MRQYHAQKDIPVWLQVVSDGSTIVVDKHGNYRRVYAGTAPATGSKPAIKPTINWAKVIYAADVASRAKFKVPPPKLHGLKGSYWDPLMQRWLPKIPGKTAPVKYYVAMKVSLPTPAEVHKLADQEMLTPEAMQAVQAKDMAKARAITRDDMLAKSMTAAMVSVSTINIPKTLTFAQQKVQVQELVKQQVKTITDSSVKALVQEQVRSQPLPVTKTVTKTKVPTKPITKTGVIKIPSIKRKAVLTPRLDFTPRGQKKAREIIRKSKSAIAWRQGQLHGKDRWDVVTNPYGQENYFVIMGRRPMGARVIKGPGSAYKTAQIVGDVPHDLRRPALIDQKGMFSTKLSPLGESSRDLRITFTRDIDIGGKGNVFPLPKR